MFKLSARLLLCLPVTYGFIWHATQSPARCTRLYAEQSTTSVLSTAAPQSTTVREYPQYNATPAPESELLRTYQSKAVPIAASFQTNQFRPLPILSNQHVQTIGGVFLRSIKECAYYFDAPSLLKGVASAFLQPNDNQDEESWYYDRRERVVTPTGGAFFHVDHKYASNPLSPSLGTVIIVHGLESNSNSTLCIDMAESFHEHNFDVAVINFRGCCGADVARAYENGELVKNDENSLMYHLGFVDDLIYYLSLFAETNDKPVFLSGFSLGANVVVKALGQVGTDAIDKYGVAGAAVGGAPFDTERSYKQFHEDPISRRVYVDNLLSKLKERAQEMLDVIHDGDVATAKFDYQGSIDATTIYELENACVAPLFGFEDYIDYYRKTSCGYYLEGICVPTFIVNARDDPFFNSTYVPWDKVHGGENGEGGGVAPVKIQMTEQGGHLGYIFHQCAAGEVDASKSSKGSWMSRELARFVTHVHQRNEASHEPSTSTNPDDSTCSLPRL